MRARGKVARCGACAALAFAVLSPSLADAAEPDPLPAAWPAPQTEVNVLPAAGGDSDIGVGGGGLFDMVRVKPYVPPFSWRIEGSAFVAFKIRGGAPYVNYQDYSLQWTAPHLVTDRVRIEVRPSFTSEPNQKYFGLGNASSDVRDGHAFADEPQYYEYERIRASLSITLRTRIAGPLHVQVAPSYTHNWMGVNPDTALATDLRQGGPKEKEILVGMQEHGVARFEYGLVWDTRDEEVSTRSGGFHQVKLRVAPGVGSSDIPYRYGQLNVTTRFYWTPYRALTLTMRLVGDLLFGNPPFYELARFEDTFAFGGANGVRGIPAQRYYGKIKAFGNFEARFRVAEFSLLGKPSKFGVVAFADGGRLWTDYSGTGHLDGPLLALKYGVGGGFRLQQGSTFLLRADVAWSPDARPIGIYFDASQAF